MNRKRRSLREKWLHQQSQIIGHFVDLSKCLSNLPEGQTELREDLAKKMANILRLVEDFIPATLSVTFPVGLDLNLNPQERSRLEFYRQIGEALVDELEEKVSYVDVTHDGGVQIRLTDDRVFRFYQITKKKPRPAVNKQARV